VRHQNSGGYENLLMLDKVKKAVLGTYLTLLITFGSCFSFSKLKIKQHLGVAFYLFINNLESKNLQF
jgi:hypothetical protein